MTVSASNSRPRPQQARSVATRSKLLSAVSRTDPEMQDMLQPALAAHRELLRREAHTLFSAAAAENRMLDAVMDVILDAIAGRVFGGMVLREVQ
jgi:hypothetical protein